jgi:N-acetylglucosamine PTS system EIICBA or EIICB component
MTTRLFAQLQRVGTSLLFPIATLPAAALLLRFGSPDMLGQFGWLGGLPTAMVGAGNALFGNLPLLFAVGIAIGLSEGGAGAAALAGVVGYLVLKTVLAAVISDPAKADTGVIGGVVIGAIAAFMYNHFKNVRLPQFLAFFGGRRFVPIITSFASLGVALVAWAIWPPINTQIQNFGNWISGQGIVGAFLYGMLNRLLVPLGLHHIPNTLLWTQFGTYTDAHGTVYHGDLTRFFHGDPSAGVFMTGFFPVMMFGLPAAALAIYHSARTTRRKLLAGLLFSAALTSFVTGITEPIEYTFLFTAPVLYGVHVVLTGLSLAISNALGMHLGFGFSAGVIDYLLNLGISTRPWLLLIIGPIYAVVYYTVFRFLIALLDLKTPGRESDEELESEEAAGLEAEADAEAGAGASDAGRPAPA